ncbi:hypothetical protein M758_6G040200 [Ceratodon purpureus]|nr:hypothetical protein M758_6G040200 [Ceratodon purpureus]
MDRVHWIAQKKMLEQFIIDFQDPDSGGISERPDDAVAVFHTFFGVAGLSLLGFSGLAAIDPSYALPVNVVGRVFSGKKDQSLVS